MDKASGGEGLISVSPDSPFRVDLKALQTLVYSSLAFNRPSLLAKSNLNSSANHV